MLPRGPYTFWTRIEGPTKPVCLNKTRPSFIDALTVILIRHMECITWVLWGLRIGLIHFSTESAYIFECSSQPGCWKFTSEIIGKASTGKGNQGIQGFALSQ